MPSWAASWTADMPFECVAMRCAAHKPHRQRQLRPVHHRPGGYRRLATAVEAFVGVRPAPQERCASLAAGRTDKPLRPTPLEQERRTARLVRKALSDRALATQCPLALAA